MNTKKSFPAFNGLKTKDIIKILYWFFSLAMLTACETSFVVAIAVVANFCIASLLLKSVETPKEWQND